MLALLFAIHREKTDRSGRDFHEMILPAVELEYRMPIAMVLCAGELISASYLLILLCICSF